MANFPFMHKEGSESCICWHILLPLLYMKKRIAIIGAGAAGCFCAIELKRRCPDAEIHVYEAATKALAKVAVTGGGRCNLTNSFADFTDEKGRLTGLPLAYPRGSKLMRKALGIFSHLDTMEWFKKEGVRLVVQDDECVFPASQDAMKIVNTLLRLIANLGVIMHLRARVTDIRHHDDGHYGVTIGDGEESRTGAFDNVIVTTGGSPKSAGITFLNSLALDIIPPIPSLFTFNIGNHDNARLMGTVVENVTVGLAGTKFKASGPLLCTHWGVSGPATLKLSSYAARHLAENGYKGTMIVNWCGGMVEKHVRGMIDAMTQEHGQKLVTSAYPTFLTQKHWQALLEHCSIPMTQRWGALNATHKNRLVDVLHNQQLQITGRCHYKDEFVTCGGVALSNIDISTMECREHHGLYFAGEVLDVDAITGGFNLQAAWSMAYVIADSLGRA